MENLLVVPNLTSIELSFSPNTELAGRFNFTWISQEELLYDLVSVADSSMPPSACEVWDGNEDIPSEGIITTVPATSIGMDIRRFFVVVSKEAGL